MRPGHRRSLDAALKMGHCAPAVMAALLADDDPGRESAVLLASAMAGGIGNSGRECGALTSSILYLGDRYGDGEGAGPGGVPLSISLSRRLIDRFGEVHGGIRCDEIRKGGKNPLPCMRAMVSAPELVREVIGADVTPAGDACPDCRTSGLPADCRGPAVPLRPPRLFGAFRYRPRMRAAHGHDLPVRRRVRALGRDVLGRRRGGAGDWPCDGPGREQLRPGLRDDGEDVNGRRHDGATTLIISTRPSTGAQVLMDWFAETYGSARCADLTGIDIRESEAAGRYFSGGRHRPVRGDRRGGGEEDREIIGDRAAV